MSASQFGNRRTPRALVVDLRAIKSVVERFDRPRATARRRLADPAAPDLAVADPYGLAVPLLDARRPMAPRARQPCGPQIRRQLAQIHMVVAGDQLVRHDFLLSFSALAAGL